MRPEAPLERLRNRYIHLLKQAVLGETNPENELRIWYLRKCLDKEFFYNKDRVYDMRGFAPAMAAAFLDSMRKGMPFDGRVDRLPFCHTMVGHQRLDNVEVAVRLAIEENIPGDLIECGVWRGGTVIFIKGILEAYEAQERILWVADSFQGLPPPTHPRDLEANVDWSKKRAPSLAIDADTVREAFERHGLLDDRVRFLEGWFADTLPEAPIERLAVLRVDGDMYSSTTEVLEALYDKVSPGGFVLIDDYFVPNCKQAVDDFIANRRLEVDVHQVDWTGIWWRKPG
jgi:O-methyltransferase